MLTFTLDHNCIIAIERNEQPAAGYLRALLARHDAGEVNVRLVATSASEHMRKRRTLRAAWVTALRRLLGRLMGTSGSMREKSGPYLTNFKPFQGRLAALGLGHLELLRPVMVLGVCFLDWSICAGPNDIALLRQIHRLLFPRQAFELKDALAAAGPGVDPKVIERKWRNYALDVHALWCHIHYGGDIFVTSDDDFFKAKNRVPLATLGAARILRPLDAALAK